MPTENVMSRNLLASTDLPDGLYQSFGPFGPQLQEFYDNRWNATVGEVIRRSPERGILAVYDALEVPRACYWLLSVVQLFAEVQNVADLRKLDELARFWEKFATLFNPRLEALESLSDATLRKWVTSRYLIAEVWNEFDEDPTILECKMELDNSIGYSLISEEQMQIFLLHFPKLLEVGAGTGYFAEEFTYRGGDILAVDDGSYSYSPLAHRRIQRLQERGIWHVGDGAKFVEKHGKGRALFLAWPEPRSIYPFHALKEFEKVGGQYLILQAGGFFNPFKMTFGGALPSLPMEGEKSDSKHCLLFLEQLMKNWTEVQEVTLPLYGQLAQHALWVFERK